VEWYYYMCEEHDVSFDIPSQGVLL